MALGFVDIFRTALGMPPRRRATPTIEIGTPGYAIYGGYIQNGETNNQLVGRQRWINAAEMISNMSIVAAGVRYFVNLTARPGWKVEPADETDEAKRLAEFVEDIMDGVDTSWTRIVRRSTSYRFHGFGFHEWTALRRDDGMIGIASIKPRPQHTITRWDLDPNGNVLGVTQTPPQTGQEIYIPRPKLIYMVDDALTDSPEGLGWHRHLVEHMNRMKQYLMLEGIGFERDLSGIPVGRAPISQINQMVKQGQITQAQADTMINGIVDFVKQKVKQPDTGIVLDSQPYKTIGDQGESFSNALQWGVDLLTGGQTSIDKLGEAIRRVTFDMAIVMGVENLLTGREGAGSLALSEDKSRNLYMNVNSTLDDLVESYDRDFVGTIWALNGFPDELRPRLTHEDASFRDAEQVAKVLADMANAGAVLDPADPAINEVRNILGISDQVELDEENLALMRSARANGGTLPDDDDQDEGDMPSEEDKQAAQKEWREPRFTRKKSELAKLSSLYVSRPLVNGDEFVNWAKSAGFAKTVQPGDLHVTIAFSRDEVDTTDVGPKATSITVRGGTRTIKQFGDAIVLAFEAKALSARWQQFIDMGASWEHDGYTPHVTITYDGPGDVDIEAIKPYDGPLMFGPESFEPINEDWSGSILEKRYNPDQPRVPAGNSDGGQWTDTGGGSGVVQLTPELKQAELVDPNEGKTVEEMRKEAQANQKALHEIGEAIEDDLGIDFEPPPPGFEVKTVESLERKIRDEGYDGPHQITDISRASFIADSPADADEVIERLSSRGTVYDKGWQRLPQTGYLDRKVYLQHPNGGVSEIQIVPRGVYQIKNGTGHKLYEIMRVPTQPVEARRAAARKSRRIYAKAMAGTRFDSL